jgi:DNA repair protein REV1
MKLDPRELRGVGIQITKLDSDKADKEREAGQATLSFGVKRKREVETPVVDETGDADATGANDDDGMEADAEEAGSRRAAISPTPDQGPAAPPAAVQPALSPLVTRHQAIAGPSRIPTSSDGIDPDFLAALPADLRQEVKQQHATTRASKRVEVPKAAPTAPVEINDKPIPSPRKGQNSAAHITKQLRPKVKTQLRAAAVAELPLYGAWAKAQGKEEVVDLTEEEDVMVCGYRSSELKELGIDPDVLAELPDEMRSEIVDEERRKHGRRKVLHKPADTSRLRSRETSGRPISLSPTRSSRAGSVPVQPAMPLLAITRPTKPALLKAVDLPDVLETVTKWMNSKGETGPAAKDAGKVKAYLLKCMDAGLGGLENAVEVLKYMHLEIRDRWGPDPEVINEEEEELWRLGSVDPILREVSVAGREWWETWRGFKAAVDEVAIRDIGAVLAI